jgi:hypothetical protein
MAVRGKREAVESDSASSRHALSPAYLAMLPMFLAYELGLRELGGSKRNAAQELLGLWLLPLREHADGIRWGLLAAFAIVALYFCRQHGIRVREAAARIWLEGLVVALTLGPALVGLTALAARWLPRLDVSWDASRAPPGLAVAGFLFGGSVYEELVFRIGLYGILCWTGVRVARALGGSERAARWSAELFALAGSSCGFAAFHFERFTRWLWPGGMEFSGPMFLWLVLAGLLLGLVYRWRGPGVAAVAHGLFNLALLVGIDPDVLA